MHIYSTRTHRWGRAAEGGGGFLTSEAGIANEKKKWRKFLEGLGACPSENFESQD